MPRGRPKSDGPKIDLTSSQQLMTEHVQIPVPVEYMSNTTMPIEKTVVLEAGPGMSYFVLTRVQDSTRHLVKRLEEAGMDFKLIEMDPLDMKDLHNGNLMFLRKT